MRPPCRRQRRLRGPREHASTLRHRLAKGFQGFGADVVLDALGIDPGGFGADAERTEEGLHRLMAGAALVCHLATGLGQEDAAIGFSGHEALAGQPSQHLGDGRLRDPQPRGDIDLARLVAVLDQVGDKLDLILDESAAAGLARVPEALGMDFRIG